MADRFEMLPVNPSEGPEPITVPDFGALLRQKNDSAKLLAGACGLIGKGQLPQVEIALHQASHTPNDHVHQEIVGVGKLDMVYDDHGQLASAHLDSGYGHSEDAEFRNGKIVSDHMLSSLDAAYIFDDQGKIASEAEIGVTGTQRYFDLAADGSVTRSVETYGNGGGVEIDNTPGNHVEKDWVPGDVEGKLKYDDQLHFQSGQIKSPNGLFGIRIGPDGTPIMVREQQT
jgi:hypothetical protein